jgi:hypothetical protein
VRSQKPEARSQKTTGISHRQTQTDTDRMGDFYGGGVSGFG